MVDTDEPRRPRRPLWRRVLSITAQVVIGLGLGAAIAEVAFSSRADGAFPHVNFYVPDAELGVRLEPGATMRFQLRENPLSTIHVNAEGYRGGDWPAPREDDVIVGTVSLVIARQQNQQHRGEISKLLVDPRACRQGIANRLMDAIEAEARARGRTVLVLDTVTGSDASKLYEGRDWNRVGEIPDYAVNPAGEMCSTTYYWKRVGPTAP